jgi:hypothetical protein
MLLLPEEGQGPQAPGLLGLGLPQAPGGAVPALPPGSAPGAMSTLQANPEALQRAGVAIQALQGRPTTNAGEWQSLWDGVRQNAQLAGHPAAERLADEQVAYYRQPERALSDYDKQGGGGNA